MLSSLRTALRPVRATRSVPAFSHPAQTYRFASQDYGSKQSGMQEGSLEQKNPRGDLEHPGPESPAAKKGETKDKPSESGNGSQQPSQGGSNEETTSHGGSPAIHRPKSAAEKDDPEVRKHNEEMENRYERSENQLSEGDNKVDKKFWSGDVGGEKEK
ncbi:hypothetical protein H2200_005368 [Cladophialophora chaetospira]|uniref:Uncharacterized protein n=1 Tax=Cladophialophora chaetospira TaxID=386627 RepID=A0AA39CJS1_9EURO|nr:hypothetical protein H2200_005368 [Cladophialophora chaetospira]